MRWVKLTLPPVVRKSWSLMTVRLTSRSLAGTTRTLVAVGTPSDASMLATMRPAAPRSGTALSRFSSGAAVDGTLAAVGVLVTAVFASGGAGTRTRGAAVLGGANGPPAGR